jgi:hypothetical protein
MGTPEGYARLKAANFPNEGGPVIIEMAVPPELIDVLEADDWSAAFMASGDACFTPEVGLMELLAAWPIIAKRIVPV